MQWQGSSTLTWEPKENLKDNAAVWKYECPEDLMETDEQGPVEPHLARATVELPRRLMSGDILLRIDGAAIATTVVLAPIASTRRISMSCVPTKKASKQLKLNDLQKGAAAVNGRAVRQLGNGRTYRRKPETHKQMADYSRPANLKKKAKIARAAGTN